MPGLQQQFFSETDYDIDPYALLPPAKVARWTLAAAFRGWPGLVLDFLGHDRRAAAVQAEVKEPQKVVDPVVPS
jgi:hypothetical protein